MAGISMDNMQDVLKTVYLPTARYQMDERTNAFIAQIEKTSEHVNGDIITRLLRYGRNGGFGMGTDISALPTSGNRKGKQITTNTKCAYGKFEITDKAIKATQSSAAAFINQLTDQMEECMTDSKEMYALLMHLDPTAVLTTCLASGSSGATVKLAATTNMNMFAEGMILDVLDAATKLTKRIDRKTVVGVDRVAKTLTFESAVGSAITDNDVVVPQGSYGLGYNGLKSYMTPDTTIFGLDRSTAAYKWLNPNSYAMGGELDELKMDQAMKDASNRSGEKVDFILCSDGVERAFKYIWQTLKRNVNSMSIKGGWDAVEFNGVPLVADKYMTAGTMHLLNVGCFQVDRLSDWEYIDQGGGILTRKTGYPAYEAAITMYSDLVCDKPGAQSTITGITEH